MGTEPEHDTDVLPPDQINDKLTVKVEPAHAAIATPARAIKCEPWPASKSQLQLQDAQSPFHEDRMEVDVRVSLCKGPAQELASGDAKAKTASKQNAVPVSHDQDQASTATASAQNVIPVALHDQASTATASAQNAIPAALPDHDQASTATAATASALALPDHDQASTANTASPQNAIPVALHDQASTATASPQNVIPVAFHDQASTTATAPLQNAIPVALDRAATAAC